MSLTELETAVEQLPQEQYHLFLRWLRQHERKENGSLGESVSSDAVRNERPAGLYAGQLQLPENFDGPLPEEILCEFEGR